MVVGYVFFDPFEDGGFGVEVVDGEVKEALDLGGVEVHGDNVVGACDREHVCHEFSRDWGSGLVFLVLAGVWVARDHGGDAGGGCYLAGVYHDEEFHEVVVYFSGAGLDDEYVFATDGFLDFDAGFAVCEFFCYYFSVVDSEAVDYAAGEVRV